MRGFQSFALVFHIIDTQKFLEQLNKMRFNFNCRRMWILCYKMVLGAQTIEEHKQNGDFGKNNSQLFGPSSIENDHITSSPSPTTMIVDLEDVDSTTNRPHNHRREVTPVYKEVVIVGNGPSAITLSYFLAGNCPYYNGLGESVNDMLHCRLVADSKTSPTGNRSLVEQDLTFLAQVKYFCSS